MANKTVRTAPKPLYQTNKVESISQYGGKITNYGLIHGEQSVQLRLELWLGNAMITIDNQKMKFQGKRLKDLAQEPIKFKHKDRNWIVKLGADPNTKQFLLSINGRAYEDLPEWDDKGIYRSSMENNWRGKIKKTDYVIMVEDDEVLIKIRHDEKTKLTKI